MIFSRKIWLYVLKSKGNCFNKFKEFGSLIEIQSEHKIKMFRSDNGGKFVSKAFNHFFKDHGIEKQMSTPYTPQQNGVMNCVKCTIVEMARNMLHLKISTNYFGRKQWLMRFIDKIVVLQGRWIPVHPKKREEEEGLALHRCVCLGASPTQ